MAGKEHRGKPIQRQPNQTQQTQQDQQSISPQEVGHLDAQKLENYQPEDASQGHASQNPPTADSRRGRRNQGQTPLAPGEGQQAGVWGGLEGGQDWGQAGREQHVQGSMGMGLDAAAQNDIADSLLWLAKLVPAGPIRDFITDLAEWFENLSQNEEFRSQVEAQGLSVPQGLLDGECMTELAREIKAAVMGIAVGALSSLPQLLQKFLNCMMGTGGPNTQAEVQVSFSCVLQAAWIYFQTRDMTKALTAFVTCQFSGGLPGGGGGTGGGGTGGGTGGGFINPIFQNVNRC